VESLKTDILAFIDECASALETLLIHPGKKRAEKDHE